MANKENKENEFNLEAAMAELENINTQLKNGEVSLQESIALYKKGVELAEKCNDYLVNIEGELKIINERAEG